MSIPKEAPRKEKSGKPNVKDLAKYISQAKKTGGAVYYENLISNDVNSAVNEMEATMQMSKRCKSPLKHLILSFGKEKMTNDEAYKAAKVYLEKLGFKDHQAIIALHRDTDNLHAHIELNRIAYNAERDKYLANKVDFFNSAMHLAARKMELELGREHDNGIYLVAINKDGEKEIIRNLKFPYQPREARLERDKKHEKTDKENFQYKNKNANEKHLTAKMESMGVQSFKGFLIENLAEKAKEHLRDSKSSWQSLQQLLAEHDAKLLPVKNGMRIACISDSKTMAKASDLYNAFTKSKLEKKLGAFVEHNMDHVKPTTKYDKNVLPASHRINTKSQNIENTKMDAFVQYVRQDAVRKDVLDELKSQNACWESLHKKLENHCLQLIPSRNGLAIEPIDRELGEISTKASSLHSSFTLAKLEKKIGSYESFQPDMKKIREPERYIAKFIEEKFRNESFNNPVRNGTAFLDQKKLKLQYDKEKAKHYRKINEQRTRHRDAQRTGEKQRWADFKTERAAILREGLKEAPRGTKNALRSLHAAESAAMKESMKQLRSAERGQTAGVDNRFPTWRKWLETQNSTTAQRSIDALKNREGARLTNEIGNKDNSNQPLPAMDYDEFKKHFTANKPELFERITAKYNDRTMAIDYYMKNNFEAGERKTDPDFVDSGNRIRFNKDSALDRDTLEVGLLIASEKFGGTVHLSGNLDFQKKSVELAMKHNIKIANSEPELIEYQKKLKDEKLMENEKSHGVRNWTAQVETERERSKEQNQDLEQ